MIRPSKTPQFNLNTDVVGMREYISAYRDLFRLLLLFMGNAYEKRDLPQYRYDLLVITIWLAHENIKYQYLYVNLKIGRLDWIRSASNELQST